jgi:hypothetical protein
MSQILEWWGWMIVGICIGSFVNLIFFFFAILWIGTRSRREKELEKIVEEMEQRRNAAR